MEQFEIEIGGHVIVNRTREKTLLLRARMYRKLHQEFDDLLVQQDRTKLEEIHRVHEIAITQQPRLTQGLLTFSGIVVLTVTTEQTLPSSLHIGWRSHSLRSTMAIRVLANTHALRSFTLQLFRPRWASVCIILLGTPTNGSPGLSRIVPAMPHM